MLRDEGEFRDVLMAARLRAWLVREQSARVRIASSALRAEVRRARARGRTLRRRERWLVRGRPLPRVVSG